jgi:hypothetical protein
MPPVGYSESVDLGPVTIACGWIFAVLAIGTLVLMLWSREFIHLHLQIDDYVLIAATVVSLILTIQTTWAIASEGQGKHIENISPAKTALVARVCCSSGWYLKDLLNIR